MPSLFSRILVGELPAQFVFREPLWSAFLDIQPTSPGHVLLVPAYETQHLAGLPATTLASLGAYVARMTTTVLSATGCDAVNVVVNDGPAAGQVVPHAHVHVIPRRVGDGRPPFSAHHAYAEGEMAAMAEKLRAAWLATPASH